MGRRIAPLSLVALAASLAAQDGSPSSPVISTHTANGRGFDLTIVHVNEAGHPTNVVPGLGLPFHPGTGTSSAFLRPVLSPDTTILGINAVSDDVTAADEVLLVDGVVLLKEGDAAPWLTSGDTIGLIDTEFGLNDSGQVLIGNNVGPATAADDYVVFFDGATWTVLAVEDDPVTAWLPSIAGGSGGIWDGTMDTCRLRNDGTPMWVASGVDGLTTTTSNDDILVLGDGTAIQEGVDIPLNQDGGATEAWNLFDFEDVQITGDGSLMLIQGDLTGSTATDDVVTLNGVVVVQEGVVLAGSSFAEPVDGSGIVKSWLDNAGNYYVRGNNDATEDDWVYRNGVVVCDSSGTFEVEVGSGEHFDDTAFSNCFFAFDGNSSGAFVVGGVTDGPVDTNGVLVWFDGAGTRRVIARESDPVDLDGNGLFDDDRFINTFGDDDVRMREDGSIVCVVSLKDAAGASVSNALLELRPVMPGCTVRNGSGINPVVCQCVTPPSIGTSWDISVTPDAQTLGTFLFASTAPLATPLSLFGGEGLISAPAVNVPGGPTFSVPVPNNVNLLAIELFLQGVRLQASGSMLVVEPTNALDVVVGL